METYLLPAIPEGFCVQKVYLQPVCASEGRADGLQQAWEQQYLQVVPYSYLFPWICIGCAVSNACCSLALCSPAI